MTYNVAKVAALYAVLIGHSIYTSYGGAVHCQKKPDYHRNRRKGFMYSLMGFDCRFSLYRLFEYCLL